MDTMGKLLSEATSSHLFSKEMAHSFFEFYECFLQAGKKGGKSEDELLSLFCEYLKKVLSQIKTPFVFDCFHEKITSPYNYYALALDLVRPLIDLKGSYIHGEEHLEAIQRSLDNNENVVLFSNHQTETDPQAIDILLEKYHSKLAGNIIFVAGHRVVTDPMAVPFSKGTNLLCIFSKNYIESPPEKKQEKLMHNRRTMHKMSSLLEEGGKCIYVAPSGGRDRPNAEGVLLPSHFDPNSLEMFRLMAQKAKVPTHFHTLALKTHDIMPPPSQIIKQLGEKRTPNYTKIALAFGAEIPNDSGADRTQSKVALREERARLIWNQVLRDYEGME